jgi:hypothetical protein
MALLGEKALFDITVVAPNVTVKIKYTSLLGIGGLVGPIL